MIKSKNELDVMSEGLKRKFRNCRDSNYYKVCSVILSQKGEFTYNDIVNDLEENNIEVNEKIIKKALDKLGEDLIITHYPCSYYIE